MGSASPAFANEADEPADRGDIVVTSQRSSESIQRVPIAITAFSNEQLARAGVTDIVKMVGVAPGFQMRTIGIVQQFNVRGSVTTNSNPAAESAVSVYTDDVYHTVPAGALEQFYDVQRVEILRGPQGTLFGRNATGGLVQVISRAPTSTPEAYLIGTAGSYGTAGLEGAISGPLSSTINGRIAFKFDRNDGWQKNMEVSSPKFDSKDHVSARIYLTYEPSATFKASLIGSIGHQRDRFMSWAAPGGIDPASVAAATTNGVVDSSAVRGCTSLQAILANQCLVRAGVATSPASYVPSKSLVSKPDEIYSAYQALPSNLDVQNLDLKMNWQAGDNTEIQSTTVFEHVKWDHYQDNNTTGYVYKDTGLSHNFVESSLFTQELLLRHKMGSVQFQGGVYYLHSFRHQIQGLARDGLSFYRPDEPRLTTDSLAVFGEAVWEIVPTLKLTVGGRYTKDFKKLDFRGTDGVSPSAQPNRFKLADNVGRPSGRVVLDFQPTRNILLYSSVSTGFAAAEYNLNYNGNTSVGIRTLTKPETNVTGEIGAKTKFWDGRATLNVALYRSETKNRQATFQTVDPTTGLFAVLFGNFGNQTTKGIELDTTVTPVDPLTIGFSGAFTDSNLKSKTTLARLYDRVSYTYNNTEIAGTPRWSYYAYARLQGPAVAGGETFVLGAYRWQSKTFVSQTNNPYEVTPSYGIARAELGWKSKSGNTEASVAVENLFKKNYFTSAFWVGGSDSLSFYPGQPRWVTARLTKKF